MTATSHPLADARPILDRVVAALPGIALSVAVTAVAALLQAVEIRVFGSAWLESLVLAILVGTAIRTAWTPGPRWRRGIDVSSKLFLEIAVVLLGASVSAATILAAGPHLLVGIAGIVAAAVLGGYGIGRLLGLKRRMAILVACGNAICGNSAIAAVAPVIGADSDEVATSIAFTAVLGIVTVLGIPLLAQAAGWSALQGGAFAGLTVYAVPQVLAAAAPLGGTAVQMGTLVKLVRVLMLGPVSLALSLVAPHLGEETVERQTARSLPFHRLVPWFILGFLGLVTLRSLGAIPTAFLMPMAWTANALTVVSMAALGLGVDVRSVAQAGPRVIAAVLGALSLLGILAYGLIRVLHVA